MSKKELMEIVKNEYLKFKNKYQFSDFPHLHDIYSIIEIESSWRPTVVSPVGQKGLMQITKPQLDTINQIYNKNYTMDDLDDPKINTYVGMRYIRWLWRYFSKHIPNIEDRKFFVIQSYNWGLGNVMKMILNTGNKYDSVDIKELFPIETKDYIIKFFFFNEYHKREVGEI